MDPEFAKKVQHGEMPDEYYHVANTKDELISIVKDWLFYGGSVISKDCDKDFQFTFGVPFDGVGVVACSNDEFLDDDETKPNPSYFRRSFDSVENAIDGFKIDGMSVWPWAKGRRFAVFYDIPMCV